MKNPLKRHIDWFLTTDFDTHEPATIDNTKAIIMVLVIIAILGGLTA